MADMGLTPGDQQRYVQQQIPKLLEKSPLRHWRLGDPIEMAGRRILIGVVEYSVYDLRLLDALETILKDDSRPGNRVDVFNIMDDFDALEGYLPAMGKSWGPPLVGIWENGQLVERAWGAAGRRLLARYYPALENIRFA